MILDELNKIGKENKLSGFEMLKRVWISEKTFQELDLITSTFKVKRFEARKAFKGVIEELYKGLD